jgi:hypothetical protein
VRALALLLALGLAACGKHAAPAANESEAPPPAAAALEQAAVEAGVISDTRPLPVGLYRSRHEAGQDSLCIVRDTGADRMRFGLEAAFGEHSECHGTGSLRRSGDRLILNFDRSACIIVAGYEGDRVSLPGALDEECDRLCSERGSLEGVSFPRVSRDEGVAHDAHSKGGKPLCP